MKLEYLWQAIFAVVGALASAYGGYWVGNQPERVGALEYRIDTDNNLKRFFGSSGDVRLIYKGVEQTNISRLNVRVANTSKKNAEKIRIYLEVKDKSKPAIITDFDVPEGYPRDIVKAQPPIEGVYAFDIDYMNRTSQFLDSFRFTLYFSDEKPPDVVVKVGAKGVTLRKYDFGNVDSFDVFASFIASTWWFLAFYVLGIYAVVRYSRTAKLVRADHAKTIMQGLLVNPKPADTEKDKYLSQARDDALAPPSFTTVIKAMVKRREASEETPR